MKSQTGRNHYEPSWSRIPRVTALTLTVWLAVQSGLTTAGEASLPAYTYRAMDMNGLRTGFVRPPREAGPWVYWFWWNSVVSREEIARELDEMAAAGLAGAELRVVTFQGWGGPPLDGMDSANLERLGHRQFKYLSDDWLDMMEFTCAKARQLGLRLALNLGQGWPPADRGSPTSTARNIFRGNPRRWKAPASSSRRISQRTAWPLPGNSPAQVVQRRWPQTRFKTSRDSFNGRTPAACCAGKSRKVAG